MATATPPLDTIPADITDEILAGGGLSLAQAARRFPPYRGDRPVNPSTVFRWITVGIRFADGQRIRLDAVRLGGRWLTSGQALARFMAAQTPQAEGKPARPVQANRRAARAAEQLDRLGI